MPSSSCVERQARQHSNAAQIQIEAERRCDWACLPSLFFVADGGGRISRNQQPLLVNVHNSVFSKIEIGRESVFFGWSKTDGGLSQQEPGEREAAAGLRGMGHPCCCAALLVLTLTAPVSSVVFRTAGLCLLHKLLSPNKHNKVAVLKPSDSAFKQKHNPVLLCANIHSGPWDSTRSVLSSPGVTHRACMSASNTAAQAVSCCSLHLPRRCAPFKLALSLIPLPLSVPSGFFTCYFRFLLRPARSASFESRLFRWSRIHTPLAQVASFPILL